MNVKKMDLKKILDNNKSLYVRIQYILEFYANKENYPNIIVNDNGFFADSILKDLKNINEQYNNIDIEESFPFTIENIKEVNNYLMNNKDK